MPVHIGKKAPDLTVSEWLQGKSSNINTKGRPLTPSGGRNKAVAE